MIMGGYMYYDGTKLLSLKDLDRRTPEIYLCTTNRTAGKTTFFSRLLINKFLKNKEEFMLVYRNVYELSGVAEAFFSDIKGLFFQDYEMKAVPIGKGTAMMLLLNDEVCGYACALNNADKLKRMSHLFNNVQRMFMDEFQSETNNYVPQELMKLQSLHTTVARGNGKQYRPVPVYLCSNAVSIINPYFVQFGISDRLKESTKFMRGHGWVLECGYVETAAEAQKNSAFNRAFAGSRYAEYAAHNVYLNDNTAFIAKMEGNGNYVGTIICDGHEYSLKEYYKEGIIYCDSTSDSTFPIRIAVTTEDHNINYVMLKHSEPFIKTMRYYFDRGAFRFKNLQCKNAILKCLSY